MNYFGYDESQTAAPVRFFTLRDLLGTIWRGRWLVLLCLIAALLLAGAYLLVATPSYVATARILIDPRQVDPLKSATDDRGFSDMLVVDTQLEILSSRELAEKAVKALDAAGTPAPPPHVSLLGRVTGLFTGLFAGPPPSADELHQERIDRFEEKLAASRIKLTYAIGVSFTDPDPAYAARAANAVADAYLDDQWQAQFDVANRSRDWVEDQLKTVRAQLLAAEQKVENYRIENNLPEVTTTQPPTAAPLAALNAQLVLARSQTAEAKVRLDQVNAVVASGNPNDALPDMLTNSTINDLRQQYGDALQRSEKMASLYGTEHQAYKTSMADLKRIGDAINVEMKRIAQSYRNAYDIAVAGEKSLSEQIARQQASDLSASPAAVQLAELQRQADSARAAYQALLDSSNQLAQRQTVPVTEARVIERAQPPDSPASPQTKLVLALAGGLGLVAGLGLVVVRGAMDDRIRSQEMLERTTHRQSLGVVPRLRLPSAGRNGPRLAAAGPRFALPAPGQEAAGAINPVLLQGFRRALADPFSPQVEVMRSINAFLAARQPQRVDPADAAADAPARVISFASLGPGEGKTTISALFATYLAQNGVKVLLIDADFRRPGLTRLLAPTATAGLFDLPDAGDAVPAERGMLSPGELGVTGFEGRLTLLPGRLRGRPANLLEERLGGLLQRVIGAFRNEVRTIIVDLPPALTLPDAPAVANLFDDIFLVAEWGETDEQTINAAMSHASSFYDRITGTLLNKVRLEALTSYGRSESVRIGYYS